METSFIEHFSKEFLGWQTSDGIFSPGGSLSNIYGILLARAKRFPQVK